LSLLYLFRRGTRQGGGGLEQNTKLKRFYIITCYCKLTKYAFYVMNKEFYAHSQNGKST